MIIGFTERSKGLVKHCILHCKMACEINAEQGVATADEPLYDFKLFWQQKKQKKTRTSLIYGMLEISLVTCFVISVNFYPSLFNQHFKKNEPLKVLSIQIVNSKPRTTDFWLQSSFWQCKIDNVINTDIKVFFSNQYLQYDSMW